MARPLREGRRQGKPPFQGVQALTQTCPKAAPSGGPFIAPTWATIARGEVRFDDRRRTHDRTARRRPTAGLSVRPDRRAAAHAPRPPAPSAGRRLPTSAAASGSGLHADRLADRDRDVTHPARTHRSPPGCSTSPPTATQTLVARGLFRPAQGAARRVLQLHPERLPLRRGPRRPGPAAARRRPVQPHHHRPASRHALERRGPPARAPAPGEGRPGQAPGAEGAAERLRTRARLQAVAAYEPPSGRPGPVRCHSTWPSPSARERPSTSSHSCSIRFIRATLSGGCAAT